MTDFWLKAFNPLYTGKPKNGSFTNSEDADENSEKISYEVSGGLLLTQCI